MFLLRSRRWLWPISALLVLVVGILLMTFNSSNLGTQAQETQEEQATRAGQLLTVEQRAWLGDRWVYFEVARSQRQQATGLMFRTHLSRDRGMIFPFDPPQTVRFWMRNVAIDLDMLFARDGRIVAIETDVPPCESQPCPTYGPDAEIDTVIELLGGTAEQFGIAVGDRVVFESIDASPPDWLSERDESAP